MAVELWTCHDELWCKYISKCIQIFYIQVFCYSSCTAHILPFKLGCSNFAAQFLPHNVITQFLPNNVTTQFYHFNLMHVYDHAYCLDIYFYRECSLGVCTVISLNVLTHQWNWQKTLKLKSNQIIVKQSILCVWL